MNLDQQLMNRIGDGWGARSRAGRLCHAAVGAVLLLFVWESSLVAGTPNPRDGKKCAVRVDRRVDLASVDQPATGSGVRARRPGAS